MSQVLTTDLLVIRALVHQEKWLEFMCFAPLMRNILTLWASSGQLMALGLENKDTTKKQDAALSVGSCVPSFPKRPHLCMEPSRLGLLILLLPLVSVPSSQSCVRLPPTWLASWEVLLPVPQGAFLPRRPHRYPPRPS